MMYLPTEPNTVLSIARATAAPSSGVGPPSIPDAGTGGAVGRLFGEVQLVATPPTSECPSGCSRCGAPVADRVGLSVLEDGQAVEYGFCGIACFTLYVRARWIEVAA